MITDVTRMGEWSPETVPELVHCMWFRGATGPALGATFKGRNKRGVFQWSTKAEVVAAHGREFSFVTHSAGPSTKWTYHFERAADGGTDLVEAFQLLDDMSPAFTFIERYSMRIADRTADLEAGMQRTLERIRAVAEATR
jgi:hypothetical protein